MSGQFLSRIFNGKLIPIATQTKKLFYDSAMDMRGIPKEVAKGAAFTRSREFTPRDQKAPYGLGPHKTNTPEGWHCGTTRMQLSLCVSDSQPSQSARDEPTLASSGWWRSEYSRTGQKAKLLRHRIRREEKSRLGLWFSSL